MTDVQEPQPQRPRGYQPYSTSGTHHRRNLSDAVTVTDYDFSQPPQAQPQAFFAHGQGQRYGAYGKVVHRSKVPTLYRVVWRRWYSTGASGALCPRRHLSGTFGQWKTRRWEDPSSRLLNMFVLVFSRRTKMEASMPTRTLTLAREPKFELNCISDHVSVVECSEITNSMLTCVVWCPVVSLTTQFCVSIQTQLASYERQRQGGSPGVNTKWRAAHVPLPLPLPLPLTPSVPIRLILNDNNTTLPCGFLNLHTNLYASKTGGASNFRVVDVLYVAFFLLLSEYSFLWSDLKLLL